MLQPLSTDPRTWSVTTLSSLPRTTLVALTRRVAGSLTVGRIVLGRCLLAIEAPDPAERYGCNSCIHYGICLGIEEREAAECRRVGRRLEELWADLLRRMLPGWSEHALGIVGAWARAGLPPTNAPRMVGACSRNCWSMDGR